MGTDREMDADRVKQRGCGEQDRRGTDRPKGIGIRRGERMRG